MTTKSLAATIWIIFLTVNTLAVGQSANIIHYQGRVAVNGTPFSGIGYFKFALLDEAGSTTRWSNDGTSIDGSEPTNAVPLNVSKGIFRVSLGKTDVENMSSIGDDVVANNAKLRVWFNSGSNGWQLLQPDHEYSPSSFAMRAAKAETAGIDAAVEARIRSLEETYIINELDDHAYRGLSKPLISSSLVWESFPVANGANGRFISASSDSFFDQQYIAMSFGVQDLAQVANSSLSKNIPVNGKVHRVEAEFYSNPDREIPIIFRFRYSDSTSADVSFTGPGPGYWLKHTALNPQLSKIVSFIEIHFRYNGVGTTLVRNAKIAIPAPASLTISLSPQAKNWFSFKAYAIGAREFGDDLKFSITDGSTTLSDLSLSQAYSWNGTSPPTSLTLFLTPKTNGEVKGTSITTMGIYYKDKE